MVIPVTKDGKIVMVKQYRYLCRKDSIEFPCGGVKDDSTYEETARRELAEETGYRTDQYHLAGEFNPCNGITDEMCRVYIATGLQPEGASPDETEDIEVILTTAAEIEEQLRMGVIWDGMTIAAWAIVKSKGPL